MTSVYALLVGINDYRHPVTPLHGCINDITAVEEYLRARVEAERFELLTLKDQQATRQAVIDGFRNHLCRASSGDLVLFYYSGHGSQNTSPPEFWHLDPDRMMETLVCWDSRLEGGWDLADKELAKLIAEVAKGGPQITVVLDACHSGSGTRGDVVERRAPSDSRPRPLSSFIFSEEIGSLSGSRSPQDQPSGWFQLPRGPHVLLAACRDNETAKEYQPAGQSRGAFSYFLMDTLQRANGSLTYRSLFKRANSLVRSIISSQSPQLEAVDPSHLDRPFLGGALAGHEPYFTVSHHKTHGWVIDGGAVHGIPQRSGDETTLLTLFAFDCPAEKMHDVAEALGEARVIGVLPQLSTVTIRGIEPDRETTFKAVVTSLPLPALGVCFEGEEEGSQWARQALLAVGPANRPSLYLRAAEASEAEYRLLTRAGHYLITRPQDDRLLVAEIEGRTRSGAAEAIRQLEHIARWDSIVKLASPASSRIAPDAVRMEVFPERDGVTASTPEPIASELRLEYKYTDNNWTEPRFRIKLTNTTNRTLYCALVDLTARFAIEAGYFPAGSVRLDPHAEVWALDGEYLTAVVPDEVWQQGITEYLDVLKLIVCTEEFDATLLEQGPLHLPGTRGSKSTRGLERESTLNRLMHRAQYRELVVRTQGNIDDWVTSQVTFVTVRPLDTVPVPNSGQGVTLSFGVELQPHPSLKANARLATVTQASRDLGNAVLPPALRDSGPFQNFSFTTSRGADPGLSALELSNVTNPHEVTAAQPLKLTVNTSLTAGEHLLPVGYDGEFFLPLGRARRTGDGRVEISLERLPDPVQEGQRSIHGSIRIFFHKVLGKALGKEYEYPLLAAAEVDEQEAVHRERDTEQIRQCVARARKVVLYIHGIVGDTESIVPSIRRAQIHINGQQQPLRQAYDLVLTFDYENLNTSIEENARLLKERLEAVGLGPDHGKQLHIVAHSMGGLVSRWFIEREGGHRVVQHLLMLGTPNAGSPWPVIQEFATVALAIGLNNLSAIAWPASVLSTLVAMVESVDVTLDQMKPGSDFLKTLQASPDPGIPYTILAGNTSIIPAALLDQNQDSSLLQRLMQKLFNKAAGWPFLSEFNDIAVAVTSIGDVPSNRVPSPKLQEVACDHLTYFSTQAGLDVLGESLIPRDGECS